MIFFSSTNCPDHQAIVAAETVETAVEPIACTNFLPAQSGAPASAYPVAHRTALSTSIILSPTFSSKTAVQVDTSTTAVATFDRMSALFMVSTEILTQMESKPVTVVTSNTSVSPALQLKLPLNDADFDAANTLVGFSNQRAAEKMNTDLLKKR